MEANQGGEEFSKNMVASSIKKKKEKVKSADSLNCQSGGRPKNNRAPEL